MRTELGPALATSHGQARGLGRGAGQHAALSLSPLSPTPPTMDSPVVAQLFRQLFSHRASQCLRAPAVSLSRSQRRGLASSRGDDADSAKMSSESKWQQRTDLFPQERGEEFKRYATVTADSLRTRKERPRRVKMLMRDFIEGTGDWPSIEHVADQYLQTACTIPTTVTSPSKSSSSIPATPSSSARSKTSPSSTAS